MNDLLHCFQEGRLLLQEGGQLTSAGGAPHESACTHLVAPGCTLHVALSWGDSGLEPGALGRGCQVPGRPVHALPFWLPLTRLFMSISL